MPGADIGCPATRRTATTGRLRGRGTGTDAASAGPRWNGYDPNMYLRVMKKADLQVPIAIFLRACYAVSGTDLAYDAFSLRAATRCPILTWRMLLHVCVRCAVLTQRDEPTRVRWDVLKPEYICTTWY
eukprot:3807336-Rhodomonas_salina.3